MFRQVARPSTLRSLGLLRAGASSCSIHQSARKSQEEASPTSSSSTTTTTPTANSSDIQSSRSKSLPKNDPQEARQSDYEFRTNNFIHRLPQSTAEQSPLLVALHSRLNLSPKFKLNTLSQCLNLIPATKGDGLANNYGLNVIGKVLMSYYVTEYLLLHYPRLPMSIHNAATDAFIGTESLLSIGRSWGIEVDEVSKLDRFLGQESEFLKYGRLRYMSDNKKENRVKDLPGVTEVLSLNSNLTQEDKAYTSAVTAIVGGIYTHCGEVAAKEFILDHILSRKVPLSEMFQFEQPITELIRLCDKLQFQEPLSIRLIAETGRKSASPQFLAGVFVGNEKLGEGIGASLKEAQTRAAVNSLMSYYLYSPISAEGNPVKVPSDEKYKFEGIVDIGDVAI